MSKYKHIKDNWVREALEEYKDKIDENKSHTEQRRLTKQPEPRPKFTQLEFNFDGAKND